MLKENKIFISIIIGAIIIGGCIYFGLKNNGLKEKENLAVSDTAKTPSIVSDASKLTGLGDLQNISAKPGIAENLNVTACGASDNTIITKVIDGDTVVVEGGYHIRLLGMDADEKGYPCYDQAKTRLEDLVLLKQVKLEKDKTDLDQYGRCLRYIFLGNTNVDVQLTKEGLAVARFYAPDVKYKTEITEAEKQAQINRVGCKWAK
ncbi:MAG: thermonuclease family protein [Candidatus Staskawiczbacteria bacterium]|nr:thermonuclease family protein [Candidatus Staskawiczbacteria bacterium]